MKTLIIAMLALVSLAASAAESDYRVHATILSDGEVIGEPVLIVRDSQPASVEVSVGQLTMRVMVRE